jgi:hypothetical protein
VRGQRGSWRAQDSDLTAAGQVYLQLSLASNKTGKAQGWTKEQAVAAMSAALDEMDALVHEASEPQSASSRATDIANFIRKYGWKPKRRRCSPKKCSTRFARSLGK